MQCPCPPGAHSPVRLMENPQALRMPAGEVPRGQCEAPWKLIGGILSLITEGSHWVTSAFRGGGRQRSFRL